jgi:hypothetical protein
MTPSDTRSHLRALESPRGPSVPPPIPGSRPTAAIVEPDTQKIIIEILPAARREDVSDSPDPVGPTVYAIPLRSELAAARLNHAMRNIREAEPLLVEAASLLETVLNAEAETIHLSTAGAALTEALSLLTRRSLDAGGDLGRPPPDLKVDPTPNEISNWIAFDLPIRS